MGSLTRRNVVACLGGLGVMSGAAVLGDGFLAPYRKRTTVGVPPTEDRYLVDQPRLSDGDGSLFGTVVDSPARARERLLRPLPDERRARVDGERGSWFWTITGAVLPEDSELSVGRGRFADGTLRYYDVESVGPSDPPRPSRGERTGEIDVTRTGDAERRYHYELHLWKPEFPWSSPPDGVSLNWKHREP